MRKVVKARELECFSEFKRKNDPKDWEELDNEISRQLRSHLIQEQEDYCPYCERHICANTSHIEHIYPRNPKFPLKRIAEKEYDYQNIIACCKYPKTCGNAKKNEFHDLFINPVTEEPRDFLTHDSDEGELQPLKNNQDGHNYKKAEKTIEILNLNEKKLKQARRAWHRELSVLKGTSKEEFSKNLAFLLEFKPKPNFPSIIQYHLDNYDAFYEKEYERGDSLCQKESY